MSLRSATALAVILLAFAFGAAPSFAADPLLSGYGGPGDGEQVVLGSTIVPPKHGNGSLRAPAPAAAPATRRTAAPARTSVAGTPASAPAPTASSSRAASPSAAARQTATASARRRAAARRTSARTTTSTSRAATAAATHAPSLAVGPAPAAGPATSVSDRSSAGPLPLTRNQVLAVLAALALLIVCAGATASLARPLPDPRR